MTMCWSRSRAPRKRRHGTRTAPIISSRAQTSASGVRSIRSVRQAFAAWQDRISGRGRYCRPAGCRREFLCRRGCLYAGPRPRCRGDADSRMADGTRRRGCVRFPRAARGAGNESDIRRRAFSLRLVGDDARYVERPGRTSPPFPGHDLRPGDRLREDWFPTIFQRLNDMGDRETTSA